MDSHGGQSTTEIYAGLALTERSIGGERRCLAHLATQQGLQKDRPARERFRRHHVTRIKELEKGVRAMEAELRNRGR